MMTAIGEGQCRREEISCREIDGHAEDPTIAAEPARQLSLLGQGPAGAAAPQADRDFDLYALAVASVRGVGVQVLRMLIDHYGDLRLFWEDDTPSMHDALARAKAKESATLATHIATNRARLLEDAARTRDKLREDGVRLISVDDPAFPARLRETPDHPYWLFVQGNPAVLNSMPLIGIVGTRQPSREGTTATKRITWLVTEQGFGVVSGLAEGIDAAAHGRAFYFQAHQVAVLGTGINVVFPSSTAGIRKRIISDGGAVVTEYFPNDMYDGARFVQRNRIQAALARVIVPVESRAKSGTAHTVRFAERYHRPLLGVFLKEFAPTNEVIRVLRDHDHPVYDLSKTADIDSLWAFLRGVVGSEWPMPPEPPNPKRLYRHVLKALDELEADVPLTERDHRWFFDYVAERYSLSRRGSTSSLGS